jgi:SAM-dependent methyltransferase
MSNNFYDNETFFNGYRQLRENENNLNDLLEQPAMLGFLPELKDKSVLDLGCGYGRNCKEFIKLGAKAAVGIDISSKMLEVAKAESADEKIEYLRLNMNNIGILSDKFSFDFVYSSLAFHYIEDFDKLITDIYNLLTPGGILLFSQEHPIMTATVDGKFYWNKNENGEKVSFTFSNYNQPGIRKYRWFIDDVIKYHRPMGEIVTALAKRSFMIEVMNEPAPKPNALEKLPAIKKEFLKPNFLIIRAKKL